MRSSSGPKKVLAQDKKAPLQKGRECENERKEAVQCERMDEKMVEVRAELLTDDLAGGRLARMPQHLIVSALPEFSD